MLQLFNTFSTKSLLLSSFYFERESGRNDIIRNKAGNFPQKKYLQKAFIKFYYSPDASDTKSVQSLSDILVKLILAISCTKKNRCV